jgi:hypothetical protein
MHFESHVWGEHAGRRIASDRLREVAAAEFQQYALAAANIQPSLCPRSHVCAFQESVDQPQFPAVEAERILTRSDSSLDHQTVQHTIPHTDPSPDVPFRYPASLSLFRSLPIQKWALFAINSLKDQVAVIPYYLKPFRVCSAKDVCQPVASFGEILKFCIVQIDRRTWAGLT